MRVLAGDTISACCTLKQLAKKYKIHLRLKIGVPAPYPPGNTVPMLTEETASSLISLLHRQSYLSSVAIWTNETCIALDEFRNLKHRLNLSASDLRYWHSWFFGTFVDGKPWIEIDAPWKSSSIVVNRTLRYNSNLNYAFLDKYNLCFVGLDDEYLVFKKSCPSSVHVKARNYFEMAQLVKTARLVIGGQSSLFWLAEGIGVPRILEQFTPAPNVMPIGEHAYAVISQVAFENVVKEILE